MQTLYMPAEGIELIQALLQIESPIVFTADSMDHGQGAEVHLSSSEHQQGIEAADFDLGGWLFELWWDLCDESVTYWAGDGRFSILKTDNALRLNLTLSRGYFSECTTPIEDDFLQGLDQRVYERLKLIKPNVDENELMLYADLKLSYDSQKGFSSAKVSMREVNGGLDPETLGRLADSVLVDCKGAMEAFDDELPEGYDGWVEVSCSDAFIEQFSSDAEIRYGAEIIFEFTSEGAK